MTNMNKPIYLRIGVCTMLDNGTVVRCVEDGYGRFGCLYCCFDEDKPLEHMCRKFACMPVALSGVKREDNKNTHFEIVTDTE